MQINAFSTNVPAPGLFPARQDANERRWFQAACWFIIIFLLTRLIYLACGRIELSEDEAYQWLWSKHLDLSYYSKPPLIAYAQFIGTSLWGDNEFGIRFLSPVLAAALSFLLLRFFAREVNARAAFWLILILAATPLLAVGSTLLTVDALSVFFWVAAMISGWRALNADLTDALGSRSALKYWLWTGLFLGLGMMSKYTAATQVVSWAIFFILWPTSRAHLRRAGPYAALAISTLAFLPVVIWNGRHNWITLTHLSERAGLGEPWHFKPRFLGEFLGSELGLLNPIFFIAMIWAAVVFVRKRPWHPLQLYLFCMGAPLFLFYTLYTLRSRVLPNWIAPSVVPLFALMVTIWDARWRVGAHKVKGWLAAGLSVGFGAVFVLHGTEIITHVTGVTVPVKLDPLHRVRGWKDIAEMVENERQKLLSEGRPVFLIVHHYGLASILSFYIPEAKKEVKTQPLVYYVRTLRPNNQFFFWPGYKMRTGQNALYVREEGPGPPPAELLRDFESVNDLGMRTAYYHGQPFRQYQLYFCRALRQ